MMRREDLKKVLIIDDIAIEQIFRVLLNEAGYSDVQITRLCDLHEVKEYLDNSRLPKELVILVNAHVKFKTLDYRYEMKGEKFVRHYLRTMWRRKEPVIMYSPLAKDEIYSIPYCRLFKDYSQHHAYVNVCDAFHSLPELIRQVKVIPEGNLDTIVEDYGTLPSLIRLFKHDLTNILGTCDDKICKMMEVCSKLKKLIPQEFHSEFKLDSLSGICKKIQDHWNEKKKIIDEIINEYIAKASKYFS